MLCLVLFAATAAVAQDWEALEEPGAFAIMRHALAPGTGDPAEFEIGRCETQRNLDDRGRRQAHEIGAAFRERGISFDAVWTSEWCRCAETAELLGLGEVEKVPALNSFFGNRSQGPEQTRRTLELIEARGGRPMLVTHQVNITALTGDFPRSGEVFVVRRAGDRLDVIGKILISP